MRADLNRAKSPPRDTLAVGWPDWRTRPETRPRDSAPVRPVRAVLQERSADLGWSLDHCRHPLRRGTLRAAVTTTQAEASNTLASADRPKTARGMV